MTDTTVLQLATARTVRPLPADMQQSTGDPHLDRITGFAAKLCGAPIALVSLVGDETQRFLARTGLAVGSTPRSMSFCAHAMQGDAIMVVPDATKDLRFADNPLVTGDPQIRFYAGAPLSDREGNPLGALCVIDRVPRGGLTPLQREGLAVLAEDVMLVLDRQHSERVERDAAAADASALTQSEERFRVLADTMPQMVWSTRPDGFHDYYNARWYEFTGMEPGTTDGEAWNGMFHPDDQDEAWRVWRHSLATGDPYQIEYRLRHHSGQYRWTLGRALPMRDAEGRIVRWFGTCTDIDAQKRAAEEREVISQELSHRIKNIFSVIAGLISFAAKTNPQFKDIARDLRERILALGRAHDFVRPHSQRSRPVSGVNSLHGLLEQLFMPYRGDHGPRFDIHGPDFPIDDRSATPFALMFHELATNAAKYGALSVTDGWIAIEVAARGDVVAITWRERGGPAVTAPMTEDGFGSQLLALAAERQLGGSLIRRWEPEGLEVELSIPRAALSRRTKADAA